MTQEEIIEGLKELSEKERYEIIGKLTYEGYLDLTQVVARHLYWREVEKENLKRTIRKADDCMFNMLANPTSKNAKDMVDWLDKNSTRKMSAIREYMKKFIDKKYNVK